MQSGITGKPLPKKISSPVLSTTYPASAELLTAFQEVVNSRSLRGLIITIEKEALIPSHTLPSNGTFEEDLHQLDSLLKDNEAAYVILRRRDSDMAPFISIAYVPDTANVRQKMLFASTRNTLLRELGTEKFGESLFATKKEELTPAGFKKHDVHEAKYDFHPPVARARRANEGI